MGGVMSADESVFVEIRIDVRGKRRQRCGAGCWGLMDCESFCDAFGSPLKPSWKHPGEFMRCKDCLEAEVKS